MLLVVVLFFGVACSAIPTSEDGVQCIYDCFFTTVFFHSGSDWCGLLSSFTTCSKPCPSGRLDAVVQQETRIYQKQCSPNVTEEQREKFVHSQDELDKRLTDRAWHCEDRAPKDDEALCKNVASCLLGSALDELKADYPEDVVTAVADWRKAYSTWFLKDHKSPPEACSFLFEPYEA
ncbi:hypothetical protein AAVH_17427 [Aphelenchoides avenae]|nr:hypothetical protein AAVH_17427 [Aphelenchus avenae]